MREIHMPEPWLTFAPVQPNWHLPEGIALPYRFSDRVSYRAIPEWVFLDDRVDDLRSKIREKMQAGETHCIAVEYEADALGSPDPDRTGERPRAIQNSAADLIHYVNLAFWLARPTSLSFSLVVHAVNHGTEWVTRQIVTYDPMRPLQDYEVHVHTCEDFVKARVLFQAIDATVRRGTTRNAAAAIIRALTETEWVLRFLVHWLALECLFGPEDGREITFRLSQRMALFLEKDEMKAREVFAKVKENYSWRSKVVHGLRLAKLTEVESRALLVDLEQLVRRSLMAILGNDTIAKIFDGGEREKYLDGLAFR